MHQQRASDVFWAVILICYALAVGLSFLRIYVYQAYPIFYTEEEIPDMAGEIWSSINSLGL